MNSLRFAQLTVLILGIVQAGCATLTKPSAGVKNGGPVFYAIAQMQPVDGSAAHGQVRFSEAFGSVKVEVEMHGLDKNSKHGIHIFEYADCVQANNGGIGDHFNPTGKIHGMQSETQKGEFEHHIGDLGNIQTDKNGDGQLTITIYGASLNSSLNPILGRSIVVDKNEDDLISQPAGGITPRISCGVIGAAAEK